MNVLFVAAEASPLIKVGGLGDVAGSLPRALRRIGVDVRLALPAYASIDRAALGAERVASLPEGAALWRADVREVPTYLVEHAPSFGREQAYGYEDDPERFLAYCDALLASADALGWQPDVIHVNDWHTALLASRLVGAPEHPWAACGRMTTIHNLGYPGPFDSRFADTHGLSERAFDVPEDVDPGVAYSALAQGILHADVITTVSPTYAQEILAPELGGELTPLLRARSDRLAGVLNGIDVELFDPASDTRLAAQFDSERLERRTENKRILRQRLELPPNDEPVVGMVTRLVEQKGADLAVEAVEALLQRIPFQFAVLGQGEERYEWALRKLVTRHPRLVAAHFAFDEPLGQLIYGGCDLFLMPSRYEPCGLGQFIAMRYGAVPVVRRTGGLADSVKPQDERYQEGTGFLFDDASPDALAAALEQGMALYYEPERWQALQRRCMAQDFSWERAATRYAELYQDAKRLRSEALASAEERG